MTTPPTYLVATDDGDDPQHQRTRAVGLEMAQRDGARVILYDRSAESDLTMPTPGGPWSPEGDAVSESNRLDGQTLRALGRAYLAEQLEEAQGRGLDVEAYLGHGTGADAIEEVVQRRSPDLLVLPADLADASLLDRLRGDHIGAISERVPVAIKLVDRDGTVSDA